MDVKYQNVGVLRFYGNVEAFVEHRNDTGGLVSVQFRTKDIYGNGRTICHNTGTVTVYVGDEVHIYEGFVSPQPSHADEAAKQNAASQGVKTSAIPQDAKADLKVTVPPKRPTVAEYEKLIIEGGNITEDDLKNMLDGYRGYSKDVMMKNLAGSFAELGRVTTLRAAINQLFPGVRSNGGMVIYDVSNALDNAERGVRRSIMRWGIICRWMTDNNLETVEWSV